VNIYSRPRPAVSSHTQSWSAVYSPSS